MKDQTDKEYSDPVEDRAVHDAGRPDGKERHHGGKHGDVQEVNIMEHVLAPENLQRAWRRVRSNAGAPGIDGMTVEQFPEFYREHWPRIRSALEKGTYHPAAVRRVYIPKPDGSERPLGVPTVLDRVIQPREVAFRAQRGHATSVGAGADPAVRKRIQRPQLWLPRRPQRPSGDATSRSLLERRTPLCGRL